MKRKNFDQGGNKNNKRKRSTRVRRGRRTPISNRRNWKMKSSFCNCHGNQCQCTCENSMGIGNYGTYIGTFQSTCGITGYCEGPEAYGCGNYSNQNYCENGPYCTWYDDGSTCNQNQCSRECAQECQTLVWPPAGDTSIYE